MEQTTSLNEFQSSTLAFRLDNSTSPPGSHALRLWDQSRRLRETFTTCRVQHLQAVFHVHFGVLCKRILISEMAQRNSKTRPRLESNPAEMDMREVARLANVSIATVSRTINHVPTVDPKLAKRVWAVVTEHGYTPNTQARGLVSGHTRL